MTLGRGQNEWTSDIVEFADDYSKLRITSGGKLWQAMEGIAFEATPKTVKYPCTAPMLTKAARLSEVVRNSRSKLIKRNLRYNLTKTIQTLQNRQESSAWSVGAINQTSKQLWDRQGLTTGYPN
ncbi:hypothetical protein L916_03101 [Phytophthora nicotianae]|uniref:Uncharacterized protein n=1 Tax=Phytophthora nicotianae TaxID=4792 RepID=W2JL35_PHYNI|nr:hypothetical protein L916_03101 [Phytophthora nicotianae]